MTAGDGGTGRMSSQFDRVGTGRRPGHRRDATGKEGLFSTAPTSAPPPPLEVSCGNCGITTGLDLAGTAGLFLPPFLVNPLRARIWTRCPSCGRRSWLDVAFGQGLRAMLGRSRPGSTTSQRG